MENLKELIKFFVAKFPQKLGRVKLIKAVYLLDCEWYKLHGVTYSGLRYVRDNNGPFDVSFYGAKDELCHAGVIQEYEYYYPGGKGYEYHLSDKFPGVFSIDPLVEYIANEIVEELKYEDLNSFLSRAYSSEPMASIRKREKENGRFYYGEVLDMDEFRKPPKPLFSIADVKKAAKRLDLTPRGSDEEYSKVVTEEIEDLVPYLERATKSWESIQ